MARHILLVEIGTEELPAKVLRKFGELFAKYVKYGLKKVNILYDQILWFASSRRLAIQVFDIFVSSGVVKYDDFYGKYLESDITVVLNMVITDALMKLPVSVMMRWKDQSRKFIRPVHTVTVLLDDQVLLSNFFGISTNRIIRGHRFMGSQNIVLDHADNYQKSLLEYGFVIVDYEVRKSIIYSGIDGVIKHIGGVLDNNIDDLLEEMTALSEWPVVLLGSFHKKFLSIPSEILLYVMKIKKKYFPIYDINGNLLPYFVFVIDIIANCSEKIIFFHEKNLFYCFSDIECFLNYDKERYLEDYLVGLNTVLFYDRLGSLYDKTMRNRILSIWIANKIGVDVYQVERAVILSKCDLLSYMVSEFPILQGIIGMYYARRDGESEIVALAQKEQYFPRFISDELPSELVSCIVSISDRVDTVSGMFIIGKHPQGKGDPLGIRRAVFGILRIILEKRLNIDLFSLIKYSLYLYKDLVYKNNLYVDFPINKLSNKISHFIYKRLCVIYKKRGYKKNIISAVLSEDSIRNLVDCESRLCALGSFYKLQGEFRLFFVVFKRIFNILETVSDDKSLLERELKDCFLIAEEEIFLAKQLSFVSVDIKLKCSLGDYYEALVLLTTLYDPVEKFFRSVIVMCNSKDVCTNRLVLLRKIKDLLIKIVPHPEFIFK